MSRLSAGILGATGMVGQQFIRLLTEHPYFEPVLLTGSDRSAGKNYASSTEWVVSGSLPEWVADMQVKDTSVASVLADGVDVVFSALPGSVAYEIEKQIATAGTPVFSNASAHRMEPMVPILLPEINPDHLGLISFQEYTPGFIITNSNCSTAGLVFGLRPLMQFGIRQVIVTTYQAVSGAGRTGVGSLAIIGNVIPYIDDEEAKLESEPMKILGTMDGNRVIEPPFRIHANCARVPVLDGHLESVVIEFEEEVSEREVSKAFSDFDGVNLPSAPIKPISLLTDADAPQPRRDLIQSSDDTGMAVKIGRIRSKGTLVSFFLLVHNTVRGAAGASILNAEFALESGILGEEV